MADHKPVKPSAKQVEEAQALWEGFIVLSKWSIAVISAILLIMAGLFVPFA